MIGLTRTTGEHCELDPAHIERIEVCPETVVLLTDGARYVVRETLDEVIGRVRDFRAGVMVAALRVVDLPFERGAALVPTPAALS
jgi:flagellar protein FlbD